MKKSLGAAIALLLSAGTALAGGSTINIGVPASSSPLLSAPVRNNFVAAANDVNNILAMFAGTTAPSSPFTFQMWANPGVNPAQISVYDGTQFVFLGALDRIAHTYAPALSTSTLQATPPISVGISSGIATVGINIDTNFTVTSGQLALSPASAGFMVANCTSGSAEPVACSWNNFANQAIGNTDGILPYHIGGAWNQISASSATVASTIMIRDSSANVSANNFLSSTTNITSAAGTTILTVASPRYQRVTGTTTQTIQLPSGLTLVSGTTYEVDNNSTGAVSIVNNGSGAIANVPPGGFAKISIVDVSTANGVWDPHYLTPTGIVWGTSGLAMTLSVTGGQEGAGTINATGLYVNGVAVTAAGITALTGDVTATGPGSVAATLASVITAGGPTGSATVAPIITWDAKGRLTAVSSATITPAVGSITGLGTGVATALGNAVTGSGGVVLASAPTITGAATFSGVPVLSGLSSGTCSSGLALNASNQTILAACPGAAASVQAGSTTVTSGNNGYALTNNGGTLANNQLYSTAGGYINKFRNGTFLIFQRFLDGSSTVATSTSAPGNYTADGWQVQQTGAAFTCGQDTSNVPTLFSLRCVGGTSNTDTLISQPIESSVAAPIAGQTVTVQFQYKQNTGGSVTPKITTCVPSVTDIFTTCTTDLASTSLTACATATWCTESYSFPVSANATRGYRVTFDCNTALTSGQNCWVTATDIRATPGVATGINANPPAMESRPYHDEIQFCERYFLEYAAASGNQLLGTGVINGTTVGYLIPAFPVPMRVTPTGSSSSGSAIIFGAAAGNFTTSAISFSNFTTTSGTVQGTIAGATQGQAALGLIPSPGYIRFNAEL